MLRKRNYFILMILLGLTGCSGTNSEVTKVMEQEISKSRQSISRKSEMSQQDVMNHWNGVNQLEEQEEIEKINLTSEEAEKQVQKDLEENVLDLRRLNPIMLYGQVYDLLINPEDYVGRKMRMAGKYTIYHDEATGTDYYALFIPDAEACCESGIELEWVTEPIAGVEAGEWIEIYGTYLTEKIGGFTRCYIEVENAARFEE